MDEEFADLLDPGGVEAVSRLVQDQQLRVPGQRHRDAEPLLHAQGVGALEAVLVLGEADQGKGAFGLLPAQPQHAGDHRHVLGAREVPVAGWALDHGADPRHHRARVGSCEGGAEDTDPAPRRPQQAEQHLHGGGFAGAVGAEEPVDASCGHAQVEGVDDGAPSERLRQIGGGDDQAGAVVRGGPGRGPRRHPEWWVCCHGTHCALRRCDRHRPVGWFRAGRPHTRV